MWQRRLAGRRRSKGQGGQSLLETAIGIPLLLVLSFNIINWGYLWFMVLALSAAPRHGVQYATQGGSAESRSAPGAAAISNLVYDNMTNAVQGATTSNTAVRVCTSALGVNSSTHQALCQSFGPGFSFPAEQTDPETPYFVLDEVDVEYTVTPVFPGTIFGVVLPANLQFHRQVYMRSLY